MTKQQIANAKRLYEEDGYTLRELSDMLKVDRHNLSVSLFRAGCKMRPHGGARPRPPARVLSDQEARQCLGFYREGHTLREIAGWFDVRVAKVREAILRAGGTIRRPGAKPADWK